MIYTVLSRKSNHGFWFYERNTGCNSCLSKIMTVLVETNEVMLKCIFLGCCIKN